MQESLRRTAEQYHLANSLMQPEEPSASADGDATHASAPDSPNHDPTVRSDAEDSGAPCENAGKRRLVPAGAHDTAGKRQKGEAANAQQSSDTGRFMFIINLFCPGIRNISMHLS